MERPRPEAHPEPARGEEDGVLVQSTGTAAAAFFRTEPAVTLTVFAAAISIDSPVCGFRPVRAERCERSTVSSPGRATLSPRVMASTSSSRRPSITESTVADGTSARLAMAETSSALFIRVPLAVVSAARAGTARKQPGDVTGPTGHVPPGVQADAGPSTVPCRRAPRAQRGSGGPIWPTTPPTTNGGELAPARAVPPPHTPAIPGNPPPLRP